MSMEVCHGLGLRKEDPWKNIAKCKRVPYEISYFDALKKVVQCNHFELYKINSK